MYYLKNTNFWMFGLFFFFYFFIMGAYFPFFPIWLHDINHISKSDTGIIFAAISLFSLLFQPLFGLLSDKLGTCLLQLKTRPHALRSVVRLRRAVSAHSKAVIRLSTESGDNAGKNM